MDSCEECGGTLNGNSRFCSNDCKNESMKNRVEISCKVCGSTFEVPKSMSERYSTCSSECKSVFRLGKKNPFWKPNVSRICKYCNIEYEVNPAQSNRTKFCSRQCVADWRSENKSGENSWNWRGGEREYSSPWHRNRIEVLERDDYRCQSCFLSNDEHLDKYGWSLEVHHIVPYRKFDSDEEAHQLSNLVTLCRSCHRSMESLPESEQREKLAA